MNTPLIAISHPRLAGVQPALEAQGWRLARLWDAGDADRAEIRAIVHLGEYVLTPETLAALPRLGLIANFAAGYDGVDVPWCRAHGIEVTHGRGVNALDVADHAMGMLIASWRNIAGGDRFIRDRSWQGAPIKLTQGLGGRRLGIVGLGAIGVAVAKRADAFGLSVAWWGPSAKDAPWPRVDTLVALAQASDMLVVACRADRSNRGLISREIIDAVGPRGLIINVSRGSVIDEDALIAALRDGRLGQAALDVFAEEPSPPSRWAEVPNTLLTPHMAGATSDAVARMLAQAIRNIGRFLAGEAVESPV